MLFQYTKEEIEWYGWSYWEACKKMRDTIKKETAPVPLKQIYRQRLIEKLKLDENVEAAAEHLVKS